MYNQRFLYYASYVFPHQFEYAVNDTIKKEGLWYENIKPVSDIRTVSQLQV